MLTFTNPQKKKRLIKPLRLSKYKTLHTRELHSEKGKGGGGRRGGKRRGG